MTESTANYALVPFVVVFGLFALRARRAGRLSLGLSPRRGALGELGAGFALGTAAILVLFGIELVAGLIRVTDAAPHVGTAVVYLVYLVLLATVEEIAFRGLLLTGLAAVTGSTAIAVVVSSVLVAVPYLFGAGANPLTVLSAVLAGVMYGLAFVRTGRIWAPIGLRCAWNFVQGPVLGFTVSGSVLGNESILSLSGSTPSWLIGGAYGPEGGVLGIVVRLGAIAVIWYAFRGRRGPWTVSGGRRFAGRRTTQPRTKRDAPVEQ